MEQVNNYDAVTHTAVYNGGSYKLGGYFTTYTGVKFNPLHPEIWEAINIQDIAHALSNCCRFGGHAKQFYSVAQHCVLCSHMVAPEFALEALLHDASEAYIADIVRPVKETELFENYRWLEKKLEADVAKKFGTPFPMSPQVKAADMEAVVWEAINLFKPEPPWAKDYIAQHPFQLLDNLKNLGDSRLYPFNTWQPFEAKAKYVMRFLELAGVVTVTRGT